MFLFLSSKTSLDCLFCSLSDTWRVRNWEVQEKPKEVILHTGCSYETPCFRTLGICSLQIQAEAEWIHGGKSTQNYYTCMNRVWFGQSFSCKVLQIRECSEEELLHDSPRLIFLPWHLQCHRVTNKMSIHPAHQVTSFPRLHPQTLLLWGNRQESREQKKVTNTISEMNLEEKWWSVSWTSTWMQLEHRHLSVRHSSPVWCTISSWDSSWGIQEGR